MILFSNAIIYPHAMMIKFFHTIVAQFTMLGPSWLNNSTSNTNIVFPVHDMVIGILVTKSVSPEHNTWLGSAALIETVVANHHYYCAD